jgi:hypothetical protein
MMNNSTLQDVLQVVRYLESKAQDSRDTGFVACGYKQDLLQLLWYIEDAVDRCPDFGDIEREWHHERTLALLKRQNERTLD